MVARRRPARRPNRDRARLRTVRTALRLLFVALINPASGASLGAFSQVNDVGSVDRPATAQFDPAAGTYIMSAGGENMWATHDAFGFVWKTVRGDLTLAARVELQGESAQAHRKAGVMFRQSLAPDAAYADVVVHGDGLTSLQYRARAGGETREIQCAQKAPAAVRLDKRGEYLRVAVQNGLGTFEASGCAIRIPLRGAFYAGLAVCAHDAAAFETAHFRHVGIGIPAELPELPTYAIEMVSPGSPSRRVLYHWNSRLEAPSFTATGDAICFRSDGRLQRLVIGQDEAVDVTIENAAACAVAPIGIPAEDKLEGFGRSGPAWLPRLSPDRTLVASIFWKGGGHAGRPAPGDYLLRVTPLAGGASEELAGFYGEPGTLGTAPWSPDGRRLVFVSREPE
jgi:TolB protein